MSGNAKFWRFLLAPILLALFVVAISPFISLAGELEEAQERVRQNPNDAVAHIRLGVAYEKLGRNDEAIASYKETIRIKPDYANAHFLLGFAYERLDRYEDAVASFKETIRIKPDNAKAHYALGFAYRKSGQYKEGIASYKEALRINPDLTTARNHLNKLEQKVSDERLTREQRLLKVERKKHKAEEQLPDISKMTEQEMGEIPEEILKKLPAIEIYKKLQQFDPQLRVSEQVMEIIAKVQLSRLMYFDIQADELTGAIKKFQRDTGEAQTGVLTIDQMDELARRSKRVSDRRLDLPLSGNKLKVFGVENYLSTKGTWRIEGEKMSSPINHSEINCHRPRGTCEVMQIDFVIPRLDEGSDRYFFNITKDSFNIISWRDSEVISQSGGECRTIIMTIDRSNEEVFQITRNKGKEGCDFGIAKLPPLKKPRISRLYPGGELSREFWKNRQKEASKYFNADFLERTKGLYR